MLKQGSIFQLNSNRIQRTDGHLVITMCYYPRGLSKKDRHEFLACLAPDRKLLADYKAAEKKVGHDAAFAECRYEERFELTTEGWAALERLTEISRERNVYLICQCEMKQHCHREILLLAAQKQFGAEIGPVYFDYPVFMKRLASPS